MNTISNVIEGTTEKNTMIFLLKEVLLYLEVKKKTKDCTKGFTICEWKK